MICLVSAPGVNIFLFYVKKKGIFTPSFVAILFIQSFNYIVDKSVVGYFGAKPWSLNIIKEKKNAQLPSKQGTVLKKFVRLVCNQ